MSRLPPIVCFAAPSGTGKTTLIEGVVRALVARGYRVGVLKSDAHRLILDTPGKDSWRFRAAGAEAALVVGSEALGLFATTEGRPSLVALVDRHLPSVDIVLGEGFRRSGLPSIRVLRAGARTDADWYPPENQVAWAADAPVASDLPVLPLGDPDAVATWIEARWLKAAPPRRVTLVVPVPGQQAFDAVEQPLLDLAGALALPLVVVAPAPLAMPDGVRAVVDVRPGLGILGALLTGLVACDTPDIVLLGPRFLPEARAGIPALLASHRREDVVAAVIGGRQQPTFALYGHRCLVAIQSALLSGEFRMDRWWEQVRVATVDASTWAPPS